MIGNFKCNSCCYRNNETCLRRNISVDVDDYCKLYTTEAERCEVCGVMLAQPLITIDLENNIHTLCVNCYRINNLNFVQ